MKIIDLKIAALYEYDRMTTKVSSGNILIDPMPIVRKMQMIDFLEAEAVQTNYERSIVEYLINNVGYKK